MKSPFESTYAHSQQDPEGFWSKAAADIDWDEPWTHVLDRNKTPFDRWFLGGMLNTCYNAVDRHVRDGRGEQAAIIHDSPVTDTCQTISYRDLMDRVSLFAGALVNEGVLRGDRVIIYMPMVPEALIAMLACARIGAVHSVVYGGFAAQELASRIDDCQPRVIVSASCGIETSRIVYYKPLLDSAVSIACHKPERCIILQRPISPCTLIGDRDIDWHEAVATARPQPCVSVAATDPLYILYTSGTTGQPKGVVRDNGGHAVALMWSMRNIYDISPGEVFWAASDIGWIVGHSYIVYAPLLNGNTTVVYEGKPVGTPDAGAFWRVAADHKVACLFTAPTAFRAIRREDPSGEKIHDYDLSKLRSLFLAGERLDPDTLRWAQKQLEIPVVDHWWQTETGWSICANCLGLEQLEVKEGSPTKPVPGIDLRVLDANGQEVAPGVTGTLAIKLPMPPGAFLTLWNADDRFKQTYMSDFNGYYTTADAGLIDEDGYVFVMSRTDDIINVAGHRLSTGAIEEVLSSHPDVAECAVIGAADVLKGQLPIGFLVLNAGVERPSSVIIGEVIQMVRDKIGPVVAFKIATVISILPKTRSGKVLRSTMLRIADGTDYQMPATIEDPKALEEIKSALIAIGYPHRN